MPDVETIYLLHINTNIKLSEIFYISKTAIFLLCPFLQEGNLVVCLIYL